MSARPILILGASGFLGARLVRAAADAGRACVAVARRPELRPGRASDPRSLVRERAADLARDGAAEALLEACAPRAVVLLAALARAADCERDPALARALNARLPARVARACAGRGARLVHVSTDLVFGGRAPRGERFAEDDPPSPLSTYGATKAAGEEAVLAAGGLVARLALLFGDSMGRGLGASDQVAAAVERGERPFLFTDERRTPLDVDDAARALLELCERAEIGVLHLAGPERVDRLALGLQTLRARGLSAEAARAAVDAGPRAARGLAGRPADVALDATRARALLATRLRAPVEALAPAARDPA